MRNTIALVLSFIGLAVQAAELKPAPDLQLATKAEKEQVSKIEATARRWWHENRGLLAEESLRIAGYFRVARPIAGFAARDERVWEVRVIHLGTNGPTGILWVNEKTEKILALGVSEKDKPRSAGEREPRLSKPDARSSPDGSGR